ncbi:MAG: LPS-assembly protein LptD, partial [Gammaproteobacteria bacterium]
SDDAFRRFYGIDNVLLTDRVNTIYLDGQSDRNFFGLKLYQLGGLLLNGSNQANSTALPVIDYDYIFANPVAGGELSWKTTALALQRDHAVVGQSTESYNHVKSELQWRRKLTDAFGITYTPYADARGDLYDYDNAINPSTNTATPSTSIGRAVGTGGVTVSYPWVASGGNATHTIEPIGQALYTEASGTQRSMPDEDARSLVFDDTNLFETQKFSGTDRIETGTRANVGVQYTFQSNDGGYARFLAGQHYQLDGQNAYTETGTITDTINGVTSTQAVFSPVSGLQRPRSDYVLGAYFAPTSTLRFLSQSRFDEQTGALRREDAYASASYGPIQGTALYTQAATDPSTGFATPQSEIIGSVGLKLTDRWSATGTLRYD